MPGVSSRVSTRFREREGSPRVSGVPLTLADISDLRAYERDRDAFRREVIEAKRLRRVAIGPLVTVVFENRMTMRFQVQEMARAERMLTDEQIQGELDVYNPLIPGPGELSLTVFIELRSDSELREWLPRLVGIERALQLRAGSAGEEDVVAAEVEAAHERQLTRVETTASVHYVRFSLGAQTVGKFRRGPATIAVVHPAYRHESVLGDATRASLAADWDEQPHRR